MRRGPLLPIVIGALVVGGLLAPVSAGAQDGPAGVAPAIGPWLGAPRGSIVAVRSLEGAIELEAEMVDPDSPRAVGYELVVDGRTVRTGLSARPRSFGSPMAVRHSLPLAPGLHDLCLRLLDDRYGDRTVDCVQATTAPPDTVAPEIQEAARGALISPTGVVMPVTGGREGNWRVTTPCGATARLGGGTFVERARVVVDPGHGGSESGAYGGRILEKNLNLEVARLVVERFQELGISAQITRTADYRLPIRTRAEIASALAPDVFLSVHHNGGATRRSSRPGTEVFYANGMPESRRLAAIMYEDMVAALTPFDVAWVSSINEGASVRLRDDGMDLYGIHRYSPDVTSIISEFVYLSNPPESALMQRQGLPELEADTIVDAILRWWWTEDTGTSLGRRFVDSSSSGTGGFDGCVDPPLDGAPNQLGPVVADDDVSGAFPLLPALFLAVDPAIV